MGVLIDLLNGVDEGEKINHGQMSDVRRKEGNTGIK